MSEKINKSESERGSASTKFVFTLAILVLAVNAGYNYVPVAYEAESVRADMSTAVLQGMAMPGKINPVENVKERIYRTVQKNALPNDTLVDVRQAGNAITAHVAYVKKVRILPFGIYTYNYRFDHTATPSGFLMDSTKN